MVLKQVGSWIVFQIVKVRGIRELCVLRRKQELRPLLSRLHKTDSLISGPIPAIGSRFFQVREQNPAKEMSHREISQKFRSRVSSMSPRGTRVLPSLNH